MAGIELPIDNSAPGLVLFWVPATYDASAPLLYETTIIKLLGIFIFQRKKKKKITEILDQKHSSLKDKIMEPNFCISSTCERQNLDQDLLSILGVKFCFRNLEIVFLVLHLKSSM